MKITVEKTKNGFIEVLLIIAGVTVGKMAMNFANGKLPDYAVPALGLLGLAPHFIPNSDDKLKAFGNGVTVAGTLDAFEKAKAKLPFLANLNLPALAGLGEAQYQFGPGSDARSVLTGVEDAQPLLNMASVAI